MNRSAFLFLALLIASSILTVNSRHETRTVITEKSVLTERVNSLQESIRRLELDKARLVAKNGGEDESEVGVDAETAASARAVGATVPQTSAAKLSPPVLAAEAPSAPAKVLTKSVVTAPASTPKVASTAVAPVKLTSPATQVQSTVPSALALVPKAKSPPKREVEDDPLAAAIAKMEARKN